MRCSIKKLIISIVIILVGSASATIINIPDDFPTIQQGIDACAAGDTVLVQPGTYYENISFGYTSIVLASLFLLDDDTTHISSTVIDGQGDGHVVLIREMLDSNTMLCGFTIQNGSAVKGGGLYLDAADIVLCHNIIRNNHAHANDSSNAYGGGIYCYYSSPTISDNIIYQNTAQYYPYNDGFGGGICCERSDALVMNNIIYENSSSGITSGGGGFYCRNSDPVVCYNVIRDNLSNWGSGINYDLNSDGQIFGNIVYQNQGGGILCNRNAHPDIMNNTITGNTIAGGLTCIVYSYPDIINNILWNNELYEIYKRGPGDPVIIFNDIMGGWPGEGNIDADPLFCNPESGDYSIAENSPCVNAGQDGADIGALGVGCEAVDILEDDLVLPVEFSLSQNFPNPFNASTIIRYELPQQSQVTIEIYDIAGRKISTLNDGFQTAGYHQVMWQPKDISSGVYFYKFQAGDYIETKKMMLIK